MGVRRTFNQLHGVKDNIDDERRRFVQRVNQLLFHEVDTIRSREFRYGQVLEALCFEVGCNFEDLWRRAHRWRDHFRLEETPPEIRSLTEDDFETTLMVLMTLYRVFQACHNNHIQWLEDQVQLILSRSTRDLGIRWKDGLFYPSGPEELDKPLVEQILTWLDEYPNEKKDYRNALEHYSTDGSLADVVKACYCAIEGIARNILNNSRTLDKNKDEILGRMGLSDGWKAILGTYVRYAHDFRHASVDRHTITKAEAEGYLYMTGLLIRLMIESKRDGVPNQLNEM